MNVYLIPHGQIAQYLPAIVENLTRICKVHDKYTVDYWLSQIYNGHYTLWGLFTDGQMQGILLTHFRLYPKRKVLFFTGAGTDTGVWSKFEPVIFDVLTRFGKDNQCSGVEFEGREGWRKTMLARGFSIDNVTYSMQFGDSDAK